VPVVGFVSVRLILPVCSSGGHVLQWLHGCESENGSVINVKCIDKYAYDGEDLIGFNHSSKKWSAALKQAKELEKKWNTEHGQNMAIRRCEVHILFLKLHLFLLYVCFFLALLDVHVFAKPSVSDSSKLILTCLATGFYPKDATVIWRRSSSPLSEDLITSSAVRPNDDGTYQLRKSVEILGADSADYDCYVSHSSLTEPVIKKWGKFIFLLFSCIYYNYYDLLTKHLYKFYLMNIIK
uniref:Ig-like domain-containing protein n=1 Tax=Astyanax mexicanus TaxID=7994 RepID=A0A3B1KFH5_ASTMX